MIKGEGPRHQLLLQAQELLGWLRVHAGFLVGLGGWVGDKGVWSIRRPSFPQRRVRLSSLDP